MNRMGIVKKSNDYADSLWRIYSQTPKAVLAAVAVSFVSCGGDRIDEAEDAILNEWRVLHENGIVTQPPVKPKSRRKKI